MEERMYTFSVYTENNLGLLSRLSAIFLKRHVNIESLTTSASEIDGVNRFVILAQTTETGADKIVKQLEKQIEVIKAYFHKEEETIHQESALYKLSSESLFQYPELQDVIKRNYANILAVEREFFVVEKSGSREETEQLYNDLLPYGMKQFVRSGTIAVTKAPMEVSETLMTN